MWPASYWFTHVIDLPIPSPLPPNDLKQLKNPADSEGWRTSSVDLLEIWGHVWLKTIEITVRKSTANHMIYFRNHSEHLVSGTSTTESPPVGCHHGSSRHQHTSHLSWPLSLQCFLSLYTCIAVSGLFFIFTMNCNSQFLVFQMYSIYLRYNQIWRLKENNRGRLRHQYLTWSI